MRTKKISHKEDVSGKILEGIRKISTIVARTLGPGGLPILIEREGVTPSGEPLGPMITKDGVTVADQCFDPDPEIDLVIQSVKAICRKTNRLAGDGTTTAIVLGEAILSEALKLLSDRPDLNPQMVRESVEEAAREVQAYLTASSEEVKDPQKIAEVATISANGDTEIGNIIRQAFDAVGAEGVITVDEGHSAHTTVEVVDGFQIRRGAEAGDRFFNNAENTKFEAEKARVILYDGSLRNYTELLPAFRALVEEMKKRGQSALPPIVVVANEFSQEVLQFLLIQKAEGGLSVCAVKSPHMTTVRTQMLEDMAVVLGGKRLGAGDRALTAANAADFGFVGKVVSDKYSTTFYDGAGDEAAVVTRIDQLKAQRKQAESPYDAATISDRIGALSNGVAKIGVGGSTELEIKERYHRIEDALNASRAAVEEGVISGGGVVLYVQAVRFRSQANPTVGQEILGRALAYPIQQILRNIGEKPEEILPDVLAGLGAGMKVTYDARNRKIVNAFDAGIIDPVKVTRIALENAVSIASLLSTCGGAITFTREKS
jgi:chaperonin GroEL